MPGAGGSSDETVALEGNMRKIGIYFFLSLSAFFLSCLRHDKCPQVYSRFILGVPAKVFVYSHDKASGKAIADKILAEWERIENDLSLTKPYNSYVQHVNENAFFKPVHVNDELFSLLELSMYYWKITDGAFDITFAPLWPIWKNAASTGKLPSEDKIKKAISNISSRYVILDEKNKTVKFTRPVQINIAGILRAYCLFRGYRILKDELRINFPVGLKLGGYVLSYGKRNWQYNVYDPFKEGKILGRLFYDEGVIVSSSGRDHFVKIEGNLYSHILDVKTGYPIKNFSNLVVYFESIDDPDFIPSVVLSLMGREKAFKMLARSKTSAGVWIDGKGQIYVHEPEQSKARWQKAKKYIFF